MKSEVVVHMARDKRNWSHKYSGIREAIRTWAQEVTDGEVTAIKIEKNGEVVMTGSQFFDACASYWTAHYTPEVCLSFRREAMREWQDWCIKIKEIDQ